MSDCVGKVHHLELDFSSLESPDDIAVPCEEPVAVVELGLCSMLSRWIPRDLHKFLTMNLCDVEPQSYKSYKL